MADENTDMKHEITIEGPVTTCAISVAEVRSYLTRKGFRLGNRQQHSFNACELYTLVPVGAMTPTAPCVFLFDEDPVELRRAVVAAARCLERPVVDVLREIAGEVLTVEDAKAALGAAYAAATRRASGAADTYPIEGSWLTIAKHALGLSDLATNLIDTSDKGPLWRSVAHAAEDLAAIALAELRAARYAPTTELSRG